jgi:acetyl-CoA acyltransferase
MTEAVIVDVCRLPSGRGRSGGMLSKVRPVWLLAHLLGAIVDRNDLDPFLIDEVIAGYSYRASSSGTNVARSALLAAGFPDTVPGSTVIADGGSLTPVLHAVQGVLSGTHDIVVACGVEAMSGWSSGLRNRHSDLDDQWVADRYGDESLSAGISLEAHASRLNLTREAMDEFAMRSHLRAADAVASGAFADDIVELPVPLRNSVDKLHVSDETIRYGPRASDMAAHAPMFYEPGLAEQYPALNWSVTAGNSAPPSDGAAVSLIMSASTADALSLPCRARFRSVSFLGNDPRVIHAAAVEATKRSLVRAGLAIEDIDVYEVEESFAALPLAWAAKLGVDPAKVNVRGGSIALGRGVASAGIRMLGILTGTLAVSAGRFGLAVTAGDGGQAHAFVIERSLGNG